MSGPLVTLRRLLEQRFELEELHTVCFDLGIDYESLAGHDRKDVLSREILERLQQRRQISRLLEWLTENRPDIEIPEVPPEPQLPSERLEQRLEPVPVVGLLVGRDQELARYGVELERQHVVIMTGMAGIGKTTLGAALARRAAAGEDRIFWFTFDPVANNSAEALFWALAAFLQIHGQPELWSFLGGELESRQPLGTTVRLNILLAGLEAGEFVLCFDDLHVAMGVPDIAQFFAIIQQRFRGRRAELPARLVLMGREVPLAMEYLAAESLAGLAEAETHAFLQAHGLSLRSLLVTRLSQRTEGNPKLLELCVAALSRIGDDPPAIQRFLNGMAGHGDVRDYLMAEIYHQLAPDERRVLGALSIFPGPANRAAVEAIVAPDGVADVNILLDELVNQTIVSELGDEQIKCHGLVRDYAYRILNTQDRQRYHERAARTFEQQKHYLAAADHRLRQGDSPGALSLLTEHTRQIIDAGGASALLEQLGRFNRQDLNSDQWLDLCYAKGAALNVRGEYRQALEVYDEAMAVVVDEAARAELLRRIGWTHEQQGDYEQAFDFYQRSARQSTGLGDRAAAAVAENGMGWALYRLRRLIDARAAFGRCLELATDVNDPLLMAQAKLGLGVLATDEAELEAAQRHVGEARKVFDDLGERTLEADAIVNLGLICWHQGKTDQELAYYLEAQEIYEQAGNVHGLRVIYNNLGYAYGQRGDHSQSLDYYTRLMNLARQTNHGALLSIAWAGLADAHRRLGDLTQALSLGREAFELAQQAKLNRELGISCRALGDVHLALGDGAQARAYFERGIPLLEQAGEVSELAQAVQGLAAATATSPTSAADPPGPAKRRGGAQP